MHFKTNISISNYQWKVKFVVKFDCVKLLKWDTNKPVIIDQIQIATLLTLGMHRLSVIVCEMYLNDF